MVKTALKRSEWGRSSGANDGTSVSDSNGHNHPLNEGETEIRVHKEREGKMKANRA